MKYQYNFGFLRQWLAVNPQIQVKTIQAALGSKSNNSWKSWLNGEGTMPVISLLRLCNAFQIPLSAFFRNADSNGEPAVVPGVPTIDDELEPLHAALGRCSNVGRSEGIGGIRRRIIRGRIIRGRDLRRRGSGRGALLRRGGGDGSEVCAALGAKFYIVRDLCSAESAIHGDSSFYFFLYGV